MPAGAMSGRQLLEFLEERMQPSSYYQPLVIGSLAEAGGFMSQEDLAKRLLLEDHSAVGRAVKTLMRWPRATLQKHGIVRYHRGQREFELLVAFEDEETRHSVVSVCDEMVAGWRKRESSRVASRFYAVIEAADGRCQACGSPGSERPLDVDHIVPRSQSKNGRVKRADGTWVPVDDVSNLQALCSRCNRGKRDTSTVDFRPSVHRLAETVRVALERGVALGYRKEEILRMSGETAVLPSDHP
jgi:5-methylcytosine-specific restriction endonuclease McrA